MLSPIIAKASMARMLTVRRRREKVDMEFTSLVKTWELYAICGIFGLFRLLIVAEFIRTCGELRDENEKIQK